MIIKSIWDWLNEDTKEALRECRKLVILGERGSGKTTLWKGLRGLRTSGEYTQTMGLESIDSFNINVNGRQVTIEKGADIGGSDELVAPYYKKLLAGEEADSAGVVTLGISTILTSSKTVVFYLVSAADLMKDARRCSLTNVPRLRLCQSALGGNGAIILLLTQKNRFIKEYGNDSMKELIKRSHSYFDECGCDGHIPVELTDSDDIEKIKKLIR